MKKQKHLKSKRVLKSQLVESIMSSLSDAQTLLLVQYHTLKVMDFQNLKKALKQDGENVTLKIYKNTLLKRAVQETKWQPLAKHLQGMLFVVSSSRTSIAMIKKIFLFTKKHLQTSCVIGYFEDKFLSQEQVAQLATIPSRDQLL